MDIPRRTYAAVVMALGGPFLVLIGALPYLFYLERGIEAWTAIVLVALPLLSFFSAIVVGYFCNTTILKPDSTPKTEAYIELVTGINQILLAILVALTGGLTDSSFVSFMLLVPVLAIVLEVRRRGAIVLLSTGLFVALILWKIPRVQAHASSLLGTYAWIISFKASSSQFPHELSTLWSLCVTVWGIYLESTRAPRQFHDEPRPL